MKDNVDNYIFYLHILFDVVVTNQLIVRALVNIDLRFSLLWVKHLLPLLHFVLEQLQFSFWYAF